MRSGFPPDLFRRLVADYFSVTRAEAFASQAAYSVRELKLDPAKVNPVGGAIAFG